jgi:hypothetical protein
MFQHIEKVTVEGIKIQVTITQEKPSANRIWNWDKHQRWDIGENTVNDLKARDEKNKKKKTVISIFK